MRAYIDTGLPDGNQPHRLILEPETDRDRKVLDRMVGEYATTNTGRDPQTFRLLHVGIELRRGPGRTTWRRKMTTTLTDDMRIDQILSPAWESVYGPAWHDPQTGTVTVCAARWNGADPPSDVPYVAGQWVGSAEDLAATVRADALSSRGYLAVGDIWDALMRVLSPIE